MKKILILGGTGFIGHNLCEFLSKRKDFLIHCIYKKKKKNFFFVNKAKYFKISITSKKFQIFLKKNEYDCIINAAGYSGNNPTYFKKKNININHLKIIKSLLFKIKFSKPTKLIHLASSAEYGNQKSPIKEHFSCKPTNTYGKSKLATTKYILKIKKKNLNYIILRLFQIYGPFQQENKLIPYVIKKCKKNLRFKVSFGRQIRDYLHIYDLNRVIEKLIDNNKIKNLIFNLGSGNPIMVKTIIKKIIKIVKKGRPIYGALNINSGEIPIFYPDINRIKKYLGWKPKVDINQGISKLINFIN